jgi:predicted PurR-regulated permease PerM
MKSVKAQKMSLYVVLLLSAYILWPFAIPLTAAACVAFLLEGIQTQFLKLRFFENRRFLLAFLICGLVSLLFVFPLILFLIQSLEEAVGFVSQIQDNPVSAQWLQNLPTQLQAFLETLGLNIALADVLQQFKQFLSTVLKFGAQLIQNLVSRTPQGLLSVTIFLFSWIVLLAEGARWRRLLLPILLPWPQIRETVSHTTAQVIRAVCFSCNLPFNCINSKCAIVCRLVVFCVIHSNYRHGTNFFVFCGFFVF